MQKRLLYCTCTAYIEKKNIINKINKKFIINNDQYLRKLLEPNTSFNNLIADLTVEIQTLETFLKTDNCKNGVNEILLNIDKSVLLDKAISLPYVIHTVKNIDDIHKIIKYAYISHYHLTKKIKFHYFQYILDYRKTTIVRNKVELLHLILTHIKKQLIINNEIKIKSQIGDLKKKLDEKE